MDVEKSNEMGCCVKACRFPAVCRVLVCILMFAGLFAVPQRASGLSLALDSIEQWGKFPRFCVKTYRWGDKFFNSYDSTYVVGSGKRMNVKAKVDSWLDRKSTRLNSSHWS